jgi:hypothetical protein
MKKFILTIGTCLMFMTTGVLSVGAQTMSFGDSVDLWAQACKADINSQCKGIRPGGGKLAQCLQGKASQKCQQATAAFQVNMAARFSAQSAAPTMCKASIKRTCSNFKGGQARILRCLIRPANFKKANKNCKQALVNAGWLDEISTR